MFGEELDDEWDRDWEIYLREIEKIDKTPNKNWTEEEWRKYGEFLFRTYNEAHPILTNSENDDEG